MHIVNLNKLYFIQGKLQGISKMLNADTDIDPISLKIAIESIDPVVESVIRTETRSLEEELEISLFDETEERENTNSKTAEKNDKNKDGNSPLEESIDTEVGTYQTKEESASS